MTNKILSEIIDPEILYKAKKTLSPCIKAFSNYFLNSEDMNVLKLKFINLCKNSDLENEEIRPMAWKFFLKVLPSEEDSNLKTWIVKTCSDRQKFENIRRRENIYLKKNNEEEIKKFNKSEKNLSKVNKINKNFNNENKGSTNLITNFKTYDLRTLIEQDINRTFQNIKLFKDDSVKEILIEILFYWSIQPENNNMSYHQGMNDLLSILFFAFFPFYFSEKKKSIKNNSDINNINSNINNNQTNNNNMVLYTKEEKLYLLSLCKEPIKNAKTLYLFFHDEKYISHDLFTIFSYMMSLGIKDLFESSINNKKSVQDDFFNFEKKEKQIDIIYKKALNIYHNMLRNYDEKLFNRLIKNKIDPTTYMVRWLRCLFCREFSYSITIQLWDIIFIEEFFQTDSKLQFIDYLCIAMYENVKDQIMVGDEEAILKVLFRYPQIDTPKNLIKNAYKIRSFFEFNQYQNQGRNNNKEIKINLDNKNNNFNNNANKYTENKMTKKEKEKYDFDKKIINQRQARANTPEINNTNTDFKMNYKQIPNNNEGFVLQNMAIINKLKNLEKKYGNKIQKDDDEDLKFIINQLYNKFKLK